MKKQILLALPLATGLFAVSGAANAAGTCKISDTNFTDGSGCRTIVVDKTETSKTVLKLDQPEVEIWGADNAVFTGQINIQSNVGRVDIHDLTMVRASGSSKPALIKVNGSTELNIRNSVLSDEKTKSEAKDTIVGTTANDVTYGIRISGDASDSKISLDNAKIYAVNGISNDGAGHLNISINNGSLIRGYTPLNFESDPTNADNKIAINSYSKLIGVNGDSGDSDGVILLNSRSGAEVSINSDATIENAMIQNTRKSKDLIHVNGADVEWYDPISIVTDHATLNNTDDEYGSVVFNATSTNDARFVAKTSYLDGKLFNNQFAVTYHYNGDSNRTVIAVDEYEPIDAYYRDNYEPKAPEGYVYDWTNVEGVDTPFDFDTKIEKETNLFAIERAVADDPSTTPGDTPSDTPSDNQGGIGSENQGSGSGNDNVDNPNTADSITLYMTVATIALLGLGATALIAKKSRR